MIFTIQILDLNLPYSYINSFSCSRYLFHHVLIQIFMQNNSFFHNIFHSCAHFQFCTKKPIVCVWCNTNAPLGGAFTPFLGGAFTPFNTFLVVVVSLALMQGQCTQILYTLLLIRFGLVPVSNFTNRVEKACTVSYT